MCLKHFTPHNLKKKKPNIWMFLALISDLRKDQKIYYSRLKMANVKKK